MGVIYILKNPSFPDFIKIGYADNLEQRLKQLNRAETIPFAFRAYATYETGRRLSDKILHELIDRLNPDLRAIEEFDGQKRTREFYALQAEEVYRILECIAIISGTEDRLNRVKPEGHELLDEEIAEEVSEINREKQAPFRFSMCDIPVGAELEFWPTANEGSGIFCKVADDRHVEYNGEIQSMTALATYLLKSKWSVAGPRYFKYKGEWLNSIRARMEE